MEAVEKKFETAVATQDIAGAVIVGSDAKGGVTRTPL